VTAAVAAILFAVAIADGQVLPEGPDLDNTKSLVVMIDGKLSGDPTQGAGIVFAEEDGWIYIVTAYHVVRKGNDLATDLKVRFWRTPRETFPAEHYDEAKQEYDMAVIKVKAPAAFFPFKRLADPDQLRKSQLIYAIGHPNGEAPWAVSYLPGAIADIETLDLKVEYPSIKAGYSGGVLIDAHGMLVGMVLNSDGSNSSVRRIDRVAEILRRDLNLKVELSAAAPATDATPFVGIWIEKDPSDGRPPMRIDVRQDGSRITVRLSYTQVFDGVFGEALVEGGVATWTNPQGCAELFRKPGYSYGNPGINIYTLRLQDSDLLYQQESKWTVPCDGHPVGVEKINKTLRRINGITKLPELGQPIRFYITRKVEGVSLPARDDWTRRATGEWEEKYPGQVVAWTEARADKIGECLGWVLKRGDGLAVFIPGEGCGSATMKVSRDEKTWVRFGDMAAVEFWRGTGSIDPNEDQVKSENAAPQYKTAIGLPCSSETAFRLATSEIEDVMVGDARYYVFLKEVGQHFGRKDTAKVYIIGGNHVQWDTKKVVSRKFIDALQGLEKEPGSVIGDNGYGVFDLDSTSRKEVQTSSGHRLWITVKPSSVLSHADFAVCVE
jgi:S1-C subfamily serine protease